MLFVFSTSALRFSLHFSFACIYFIVYCKILYEHIEGEFKVKMNLSLLILFNFENQKFENHLVWYAVKSIAIEHFSFSLKVH